MMMMMMIIIIIITIKLHRVRSPALYVHNTNAQAISSKENNYTKSSPHKC